MESNALKQRYYYESFKRLENGDTARITVEPVLSARMYTENLLDSLKFTVSLKPKRKQYFRSLTDKLHTPKIWHKMNPDTALMERVQYTSEWVKENFTEKEIEVIKREAVNYFAGMMATEKVDAVFYS